MVDPIHGFGILFLFEVMNLNLWKKFFHTFYFHLFLNVKSNSVLVKARVLLCGISNMLLAYEPLAF